VNMIYSDVGNLTDEHVIVTTTARSRRASQTETSVDALHIIRESFFIGEGYTTCMQSSQFDQSRTRKMPLHPPTSTDNALHWYTCVMTSLSVAKQIYSSAVLCRK